MDRPVLIGSFFICFYLARRGCRLRAIVGCGNCMITSVALAADVFDELALAELGKATLDRAQRNLGLGDDIRGVAARIRLNAGMNHVEFLLWGNDGLPFGLRPGLALRSLFPCCFGLASLKTLGNLVGNRAAVFGIQRECERFLRPRHLFQGHFAAVARPDVLDTESKRWAKCGQSLLPQTVAQDVS